MKVSVNLGSARPGGLDISLYGLAHQTYQDFEIVFADARYHERHERVLDLYDDLGIHQPLYHVPNHRYNGTNIWQVPSSGFNTGYMLSEGEIVLMLMDYAYAPPNWIEDHVRAHEGVKRMVMAPHEYHLMPYDEVVTNDDDPTPVTRFELNNISIESLMAQRARFDEISVFKHLFTPKMFDSAVRNEHDIKESTAAGHRDGPLLPMHHKNESFPLEALLEINGADERFDCGGGPGDPDMAYRLWLNGCEGWVIHDGRIKCFDPRGMLPNGGNLFPEEGRLPAPWDYKWSRRDGRTMFEGFIASQRRQADHPYSLREKRKEIWNWRELSQHRDSVIPKIIIPDKEYFSYLGI